LTWDGEMFGPKCPYCKGKLDKSPKRKKKCPHCEKDIFVRKGVMYTEDDAKREDYLIKFEGHDVTREVYEKHERDLTKQFGFKPASNDVVWRILNVLVGKGDYHAYLEMARIAEMEGKDSNPYLEKFAKCTLLEMMEDGFVTHVRTNTCNDQYVCKNCKILSQKKIPINEALEYMPIPRLCTGEKCRCSYVAAQYDR
jgi:hypothetical protein